MKTERTPGDRKSIREGGKDVGMTTKHTPGPWDMDHLQHGDNLILSKSGYVIASVGGRLRAYQHQQKANAALIAAAPDLLEALIEVSDECRRMQVDLVGTTLEGRPGTEGLTYQKVQAAIAKAEGRDK